MEALFIKLLNISITASWVALAVIGFRLFFKKTPKFITVFLWALVGLRLLLPFSVESKLSLIPDAEPVIIEDTVNTDADTRVENNIYSPPPIQSGGNTVTVTPPMGDVTVNTPADVPDGEQKAPVVNSKEEKAEENGVLAVVSAIWIVGIAAMLIYAAISYIRVKRSVKAAVNMRDKIWMCDGLTTPFILGTVRPKIYLPSSIDGKDAEYVIAHENAHIKRGDHLWKPLGFLLLCVYWYNPLLWVSYVLLCRDIELATDEKVIRSLGDKHKKPYSYALINCSEHRKLISVCPLAFGEVAVKSRIKSILNYKKPAFWVMVTALILCVAIILMFMTNPKDDPVGRGYKNGAEESTEESEESAEDFYEEDSNEGFSESIESEDSAEESFVSESSNPVEESSDSVVDEPVEESGDSIVDEPIEDNNDSVVDEPIEDNNDSVVDEPIEDNNDSVVDEPIEDNNDSVVDEPIEDNNDSVVDEPIEDNNDSVVDEPIEDNNDSVVDEPIEDNDEPVTSEKPLITNGVVTKAPLIEDEKLWSTAVNNLYVVPYTGFTPIHKIDNVAEFENFEAIFDKNDAFNFGVEGLPSYNASTSGCDKAFFEDYSLIVVYIRCYESYRYVFSDAVVSKDGKALTLVYENSQKNSYSYHDRAGAIFVVAGVLKSAIENCESYSVAYRQRLTVYAPAKDPDGFVAKDAYFSGDSADIINTLIREGAVPEGAKMTGSSMSLSGDDNGVIYVNLKEGFEELVCDGGYTEYYSIGSLVNSIMWLYKYWGYEPVGVLLEIDGRPLETNLFGTITEPLGFFENREFNNGDNGDNGGGGTSETPEVNYEILGIPAGEHPTVGVSKRFCFSYIDIDDIYATALNADGQRPLHRLDSAEDARVFKQKYNIDGRFENSYGGEPTFGELLDACNDDFFEDYTLFFIYFETSSSNEFAINEIALSQDGKTVDVSYYQTNNPQFSTCDTVGKILTVPVLKSYIEGRDVFTVSNRPPEGFVAPEEPPIYAD